MFEKKLSFTNHIIGILCSLLVLVSSCSSQDNKDGDNGTPPVPDAGPQPDAGPVEDASIPELDWARITGGTFDMGMAESDPGHSVTIADFEIMKKEVTVSEYRDCISFGICSPPATQSGCNLEEAAGFEDHPVNCVNWQQSVDFCTWMGARLPSESEWEYAARSMGETNPYPWGDAAPSCDLAVTLMDGDNNATGGCDTNRTFAVCSKTAGNSEQDLCDMAGNVAEWVQDKYSFGYDHIPADGSAYESDDTERVIRGGAFASPQVYLETTNRNGHIDPTFQTENVGFRCVR